MRQLVAQFPQMWLIVLAMLVFLGVFVGWCFYALAPARKAHFDEVSRLPLDE